MSASEYTRAMAEAAKVCDDNPNATPAELAAMFRSRAGCSIQLAPRPAANLSAPCTVQPSANSPQTFPQWGEWRCSECGELNDDVEKASAWRWTGNAWEHWHPVVGHVWAKRVAAPPPSPPTLHDPVPAEVHERGWQWRPVGDGAFAPPFGTIRVCRVCGCLVAGGPTACVRCVRAEESAAASAPPHPEHAPEYVEHLERAIEHLIAEVRSLPSLPQSLVEAAITAEALITSPWPRD